ncbi:hypothetical protein QCA50_004958 [Cerrena zonata]|uniref:Uncharacterized protein n=1 Tax=Cerrena zonata TaxID=2478898 RepID=A0AAW0GIF0_9APHY
MTIEIRTVTDLLEVPASILLYESVVSTLRLHPLLLSHHPSNNHDETARRVATGQMGYINLHRAMLFPQAGPTFDLHFTTLRF